jgi:hypothetical protein
MNLDSSNSEILLEYKIIDFDNVVDISLFKEFYSGLLTKEFPDENDHDYLEIILNQVTKKSESSISEYSCIIAIRGEKISGGIIGNYYWKSNNAIIEYVAVDSEERGKRIASNLIKILTEFMCEEAKKYQHEMIDYFFLEIETSSKFEDPELKKMLLIGLGFWQKISVKTLKMQYIQPSVQKGKNMIDNLMLNVIIYSSKLNAISIPKQTVLSFLHDNFQDCEMIEGIDRDEYYKELLKEIKSDEIDLTPIIEKRNSKNI